MKVLLGNINSRKPIDFAEAAALAAWECSPRSQAKFALTCGPDRRLYVRRYNFENRINQAEWIATPRAASISSASQSGSDLRVNVAIHSA